MIVRLGKKREKKYDTDLKYEIFKCWKGEVKKVVIIPIIIGALGLVTKNLKWYYDEKIVYPISILFKSIFEMRQNGILGFSIPHLVPEIVRFLRYANEERMTLFTHRE